MITMFGCFLILLSLMLGVMRGALRIVSAFLALGAAGLLGGPLRFLTSWMVAATGQVPRIFIPVASTVTTGILLFIVFIIPMELALRKRERIRKEDGLNPLEPWEQVVGAGLGALWGLCLTVLILLGISSVSRVDRAMRVANAELDYRASRRREEEQKSRHMAQLTHTRPAPVSLEVELRPVEERDLKVAAPQGGLGQLGSEVETSIFAPMVDRVSPVDQKREQLLRDLAVVVGDPVLMERFQQNPSVVQMEKDPHLQELSKDPEIASAIRQGRFRDLLDNPKIGEVAEDAQLRQALAAMDIEGILKDVKGSKLPARR